MQNTGYSSGKDNPTAFDPQQSQQPIWVFVKVEQSMIRNNNCQNQMEYLFHNISGIIVFKNKQLKNDRLCYFANVCLYIFRIEPLKSGKIINNFRLFMPGNKRSFLQNKYLFPKMDCQKKLTDFKRGFDKEIKRIRLVGSI